MKMIIPMLIAGLLVGGGCSADANPPLSEPTPTAYQKYPLDEVQKRAKELEPGMPRVQVLLLLGSPAEKQPHQWIYRDSREGLLLPTSSLVVEFENGKYTRHHTVPVVLGEELGH
jgi:hypothetical protein